VQTERSCVTRQQTDVERGNPNSKVKVKLSQFFLTEHHAMKVVLGEWRYSSMHS
jgi:hypothetical protein